MLEDMPFCDAWRETEGVSAPRRTAEPPTFRNGSAVNCVRPWANAQWRQRTVHDGLCVEFDYGSATGCKRLCVAVLVEFFARNDHVALDVGVAARIARRW